MYKVKYGLAPSIVNELFKQKSSSYSLRNSDFDIHVAEYHLGKVKLERAG